MDFLYQKLPKDLVYIIEEYAKDRTQYDKVVSQFWSMNKCWSFDRLDRQHTCIGLLLLCEMRDIREYKHDIWYKNIKKLKKPHGKRPPTYKSQSKKYILRFGDKRMQSISQRSRRKNVCITLSFKNAVMDMVRRAGTPG